MTSPRKIQGIIDYFHMDDETRDSYMTLEMKIIEETKYARKIALEEGKLLEIISCVKDGIFSEEVGAKRAGLPLEEFRKRLAN